MKYTFATILRIIGSVTSLYPLMFIRWLICMSFSKTAESYTSMLQQIFRSYVLIVPSEAYKYLSILTNNTKLFRGLPQKQLILRIICV